MRLRRRSTVRMKSEMANGYVIFVQQGRQATRKAENKTIAANSEQHK